MRRMLLIGALLAAFALGLMSGNRLPAAHTENPAAPNLTPLTTPTVMPGSVVALQPIRWQIFTLPTPDRTQTVVILLDSLTGASFMLSPSNTPRVPYVWEHLDRTP